MRGYSSAGRAPALQAGSQEFESPYLHSKASDKCLGLFSCILPFVIQRLKLMVSGAKSPETRYLIFYKSASFGSVRCYEMKPAKYPAKKTLVIKYATMVDTATLMSPGIMKEWLRRYLPITVVPERSKFTVAISEG